MKNLLATYLGKLGLKDYSELSAVEKATYKQWEDVLSKEVRIEDVAKFIQAQKKSLEKKLRDATREGESREALLYTARIDNYEAIITFIKEPLERRKSLERELLNNIS